MSELRDRVLYVNEPLLDFNNERGNPSCEGTSGTSG